MIDFKRLLDEDPAERDARIARQEIERRDRATADDTARRTAWARTTLIVTLGDDAELRFTRDGTHQIILRGETGDGLAVVAIYRVPDHHQDHPDALCRLLAGGATVALAGYWKDRQWRDQTGRPRSAREFQTQFIRDPKTIAPTPPQDVPEPPW